MTRRFGFILGAGLGVLSLSGCSQRLSWRSDWQRALAEARGDHQPAILMFSAALCPRCLKMDKEVFTDPRVREELELYTRIRVDLITHADLAREYGFSGTPSFVVFSPVGRVVGRHAGALDAQDLVRFLAQSRMNR